MVDPIKVLQASRPVTFSASRTLEFYLLRKEVEDQVQECQRAKEWLREMERSVHRVPHIAQAEVFSLNERATGLVAGAISFAKDVVQKQKEEAAIAGSGNWFSRTNDKQVFTQAGGSPIWSKEFLSVADPEQWAD